MVPRGTDSPPSRLASATLGSYRLLNLLAGTEFFRQPNAREVEEAVYLTQQPWAARHPDHVFQHGWAVLLGNANVPSIQRLLQVLAQEFLHAPHGRVQVRLEWFGVWQQSVMSRISGLPVLAAARAAQAQSPGARVTNRPDLPGASPLLRPEDGAVEAYIRHEGLHETHLHLNGSTHAETCWLQALRQPESTVIQFAAEFHAQNKDGQRIRELCHAVDPEFRPQRLLEHLRHAACLRHWLLVASTECLADCLPQGTPFPLSLAELLRAPRPRLPAGDTLVSPTLATEVDWMTRLLLRLDTPGEPAGAPPEWLGRLLHLYVLLLNQYYRLLVQEESQYGFDQFQRFTFVPLRWEPEASYFHRMQLMHGELGANFSRTGCLEGRFAPKSKLADNEELLQKILGDYRKYLAQQLGDPPENPSTLAKVPSLGSSLNLLDSLAGKLTANDRRVHHLALVAHFIKEADTDTRCRSGYRYQKLRRTLDQKAAVLAHTLRRWPQLRRWVRGVDAAANELHAPPEVFASCFRACKEAGLTRRTYHAGEDFVHLASGLRAMHDAVTLLELRDGDRLGHGTAMGINPALWLQRTPHTLHLAKGDWLLDLLAAWQLLRDQEVTLTAVGRTQRAVAELGSELLGRDVSATALEAAMAWRHLHPAAVRTVLHAHGLLGTETRAAPERAPHALAPRWRAELELAHQAASTHAPALQLCWQWWSDKEVRHRSAQRTEVRAAFWSEPELLAMQQGLMRLLLARRVLVETLPSSNVRISLYEGFHEHHALRWMRAPGHEIAGDPQVLVTLGSDDPGIFAGDLSSEFYQLYGVLRNQGLSDHQALGLLKPVNERGREFGFHHPPGA